MVSSNIQSCVHLDVNLLEGLDDDGEQDVDEDEGARHGEDEEHESRGRRLRLAGNLFYCY